ncbi:hypothetical protein BH10PSE13_BH10PSE13_17080 [soil metagenome]
MEKQLYFTIVSHLIGNIPYVLRLVVQMDSNDAVFDHYFEYGSISNNHLTLGDSLWSSDPDALIDQMPMVERFHASMDLRLFLRTDLEDALDGSLMADDFEVILNNPHAATSSSYAQGSIGV